ncbi:MAG: Glyoxalase/bleomycin resistance protein/dioxygenase [Solirubrobacterales bacterium]|nr:Glyoxalase/bleomycin resistance protein/dioxygenase [Solirubrobacterales bacterium]
MIALHRCPKETDVPDYAPGTPSWVDLGSPDPDASVRFYGGLFGWNATEPGPVQETGGYRMFQQDDARIGGLMPLMQEGQPPAWSTYVSVADADATAAAVTANGGSVLAEPMDITDIGRMAIFADPAGAVFGVWEPRTFAGADLVNAPNSLCWNELATRDVEGAKAFYPAVFGWEPGSAPLGPDDEYTVWNLDGRPAGGMMAMGDGFPAEVPPHWNVCFAVADADAVATAAEGLGGAVDVPPTDIPIGRFAVLRDPHGASFAVMQFPEDR